MRRIKLRMISLIFCVFTLNNCAMITPIKQESLSPILVQQIDHLVLTVTNIERSIAFYTKVLGMEEITFQQKRKALKFGTQKINLHQFGQEFEPKAIFPSPGSMDLCLLIKNPIKDAIKYLESLNIKIEEGPVKRTGANGPILSIYIRDPDNNLIELANQFMSN